ncbi:hypothetical protein VP01_751g1 [Puccinia sorghi]|uniref:Uncharacterized protein n=1 Tax=Puccinia sorghi TaxID=27349 RepID=A0A0L6UE81_9BASI|nr:hypothetical protein VP01_751g1 [Puccinia sorghi]
MTPTTRCRSEFSFKLPCGISFSSCAASNSHLGVWELDRQFWGVFSPIPKIYYHKICFNLTPKKINEKIIRILRNLSCDPNLRRANLFHNPPRAVVQGPLTPLLNNLCFIYSTLNPTIACQLPPVGVLLFLVEEERERRQLNKITVMWRNSCESSFFFFFLTGKRNLNSISFSWCEMELILPGHICLCLRWSNCVIGQMTLSKTHDFKTPKLEHLHWLPSKLHLFACVDVLANTKSFIGLCACQLQAVEQVFFAVHVDVQLDLNNLTCNIHDLQFFQNIMRTIFDELKKRKRKKRRSWKGGKTIQTDGYSSSILFDFIFWPDTYSKSSTLPQVIHVLHLVRTLNLIIRLHESLDLAGAHQDTIGPIGMQIKQSTLDLTCKHSCLKLDALFMTHLRNCPPPRIGFAPDSTPRLTRSDCPVPVLRVSLATTHSLRQRHHSSSTSISSLTLFSIINIPTH